MGVEPAVGVWEAALYALMVMGVASALIVVVGILEIVAYWVAVSLQRRQRR